MDLLFLPLVQSLPSHLARQLCFDFIVLTLCLSRLPSSIALLQFLIITSSSSRQLISLCDHSSSPSWSFNCSIFFTFVFTSVHTSVCIVSIFFFFLFYMFFFCYPVTTFTYIFHVSHICIYTCFIWALNYGHLSQAHLYYPTTTETVKNWFTSKSKYWCVSLN